MNETEKAKKKIENIEQKLEQQSKLVQEYQTELSKSEKNAIQKILLFKMKTIINQITEKIFMFVLIFKDKRIQLTNYSIKSNKEGHNNFNLNGWIVEVSNDGESWTNVDEHQNYHALNKSNAIVTFNVKKIEFLLSFCQTSSEWKKLE